MNPWGNLRRRFIQEEEDKEEVGFFTSLRPLFPFIWVEVLRREILSCCTRICSGGHLRGRLCLVKCYIYSTSESWSAPLSSSDASSILPFFFRTQHIHHTSLNWNVQQTFSCRWLFILISHGKKKWRGYSVQVINAGIGEDSWTKVVHACPPLSQTRPDHHNHNAEPWKIKYEIWRPTLSH